MTPLALTADQAATLLGYVDRHGHGRGELVRNLWREGKFPPPIDVTLPASRLRWPRSAVERYAEHGWRPIDVLERMERAS